MRGGIPEPVGPPLPDDDGAVVDGIVRVGAPGIFGLLGAPGAPEPPGRTGPPFPPAGPPLGPFEPPPFWPPVFPPPDLGETDSALTIAIRFSTSLPNPGLLETLLNESRC